MVTRLQAGDGASRSASAEETAAEERSLEGAIAVHPAAAEATRFARRVKARDRLAVRAECLRGEIGLDAAEALTREYVQLDRDQRPGRRVEDAVRLRDPD